MPILCTLTFDQQQIGIKSEEPCQVLNKHEIDHLEQNHAIPRSHIDERYCQSRLQIKKNIKNSIET
jgi:hypothetical protein